jgi:hypothetical protein
MGVHDESPAAGRNGDRLRRQLADLVLLDADLLEAIRNTQRIWQMIQVGWVVDRQALLARHAPLER